MEADIGRLNADDGICTIQPFSMSNMAGDVAHGSAHNVTEGARAVIQQCVMRRGIGGSARKIGKNVLIERSHNNVTLCACLAAFCHRVAL